VIEPTSPLIVEKALTAFGTGLKWLAVWTKPRAERVAAGMLEARGVAVWLPTITVRRRWSDRWKEVEVPMFPGYLFAQAGIGSWPELLRVHGVLTIVKQGRVPAWLRDHQMLELRAAVERICLGEQEPEVVDDYEVGERVRVIDGPMAGLVGIVREKRGGRRLLVGVEQIGRALSLSIGAARVERVAVAEP
jgi:transcription antitermination factor NusG